MPLEDRKRKEDRTKHYFHYWCLFRKEGVASERMFTSMTHFKIKSYLTEILLDFMIKNPQRAYFGTPYANI